jgi:hypothetical protein
MRDARYTSTVLAACGLALLLASYVWMATMLPRISAAEMPASVRVDGLSGL